MIGLLVVNLLYVIGCYAAAVPVGRVAYKNGLIGDEDVMMFIVFSPIAVPVCLGSLLMSYLENKVKEE